MIVYPFVEGRDGYEVALSDQQWIAFGAAMRRIHAAQLPPDLARLLPREDFSPRFREQVKMFQAQAESTEYADPIAARLAEFMRVKRDDIIRLVDRADELGSMLQSGSAKMVLCHSDIHPGNLHIMASGAFYIVDWDNPSFAPKEHDLGLIGGDGAGAWGSARAEALFYYGYGETTLDHAALWYYRYERIVQDIAAFCEQVLLTTGASEDREQAYRWMTGQFVPGHEVEVALRTDRATDRNG
jgi:spectinomycin phosphotransferase